MKSSLMQKCGGRREGEMLMKRQAGKTDGRTKCGYISKHGLAHPQVASRGDALRCWILLRRLIPCLEYPVGLWDSLRLYDASGIPSSPSMFAFLSGLRLRRASICLLIYPHCGSRRRRRETRSVTATSVRASIRPFSRRWRSRSSARPNDATHLCLSHSAEGQLRPPNAASSSSIFGNGGCNLIL